MTSICPQCHLPIFYSASGYAAPMCQCRWPSYGQMPPIPHFKPDEKESGCKPLIPLTEDAVRRIVREELAKQGEVK